MALVQHYRHVSDIGGFEVRDEKLQDMGQVLDIYFKDRQTTVK